jgi:hypothetical protein
VHELAAPQRPAGGRLLGDATQDAPPLVGPMRDRGVTVVIGSDMTAPTGRSRSRHHMARTVTGSAATRGCSEWLLTGTTTQGDRVEVRGCDLFVEPQDAVAVLRNRRRRRLLLTTNTLEKAMAAPAIMGLSRPAAARGMAATL